MNGLLSFGSVAEIQPFLHMCRVEDSSLRLKIEVINLALVTCLLLLTSDLI